MAASIPPPSSLPTLSRASPRDTTPRKQDQTTRRSVTRRPTPWPGPIPPTKPVHGVKDNNNDIDDDSACVSSGIAQPIIGRKLEDGCERDWEVGDDCNPGYVAPSIETDPTVGSSTILKCEVHPEGVRAWSISSSGTPAGSTGAYTGTLLTSAKTYPRWRTDLLSSIPQTYRDLLERRETECPAPCKRVNARRAWASRNERLYECIWESLGGEVRRVMRGRRYVEPSPGGSSEGSAYGLWRELEGMFGGREDSEEDGEDEEYVCVFDMLEDLLWESERSEGWTGKEFRRVARRVGEESEEIERLFGRGFLKDLVGEKRALTAQEKMDIQALLDVRHDMGDDPDESSLQPVRELRAALEFES